jgi:hypothetical protein
LVLKAVRQRMIDAKRYRVGLPEAGAIVRWLGEDEICRQDGGRVRALWRESKKRKAAMDAGGNLGRAAGALPQRD